ncbi:MAG: toll/interleukin-1 receptor domain-containing protein [Chloroflexi bacterium]|nr:toll/interleukin-1 receptor domain-containing protein [Chloroflexota bacterium]MYD49646.1 toll/interleukin-1 receptor domain-containing protein [Chloroflexota bacterium]
MTPKRDHLFISYATEQSFLSDWLARRLAAEGYAVWYDRLKLLGGENWPNDIDKAIDERTFRMIALLSRASMQKPNPQGEWLKGRAIGNKLGINDFVIPLNVEGLTPDEITWNYQPITYIPFTPSWHEGLASLLAKLESINAPRTLPNGPLLAVRSMVQGAAVHNEPEQLISNCFEVELVPRFIRQYRPISDLSAKDAWAVRRAWASRMPSTSQFLAFHDPPAELSDRYGFQLVDLIDWRKSSSIHGIKTRDLIVSLLHGCMDQALKSKGMVYRADKRQWYLPHGLLRNNTVSFRLSDGTSRRFLGLGERKFPTKDGGEVYRYHLSPSFSVLQDHTDPFVLFLRNRIYFTDTKGVPLSEQKTTSRRKHLCRFWFNKEWSARTLGIAQLLADEDMKIRVGPHGDQQLIINAWPITLNAPIRIRDELVAIPDKTHPLWHEDGEELNEAEG